MAASELLIQTPPGETMLDITPAICDALKDMPAVDGFCMVFIPHTTAGVTINENADPEVRSDMLMAFDRLVPSDLRFRHSEGNSGAHVKATLVGSSVLLPVRHGRPDLGTWQGVYLCEFDGPRRRRVILQVSQSALSSESGDG